MTLTTQTLPSPLIIATRESQLAMTQSEQIAKLISQKFDIPVNLLGMTTKGDQVLDRALSLVGGKGVFIKELEVAMQEGRAHLAVHSLKDVPMLLPEGFVLAAIPKREDPRDAFVSNRFASLDELPKGATIGTSSLRRQVLLKDLRPDLQIKLLRGNINTRLKHLDDGAYDAIILAAAGLKRLGFEDRITQLFNTEQMTPSAGQGALGLEAHHSQPEVLQQLAELTDTTTFLACKAERAVSRTLDGGCSVPLAAHAIWTQPNELLLSAAWGDVEGKLPLIRVKKKIQLEPVLHANRILEAQKLGQDVANELIARGAKRPSTEKQ